MGQIANQMALELFFRIKVPKKRCLRNKNTKNLEKQVKF